MPPEIAVRVLWLVWWASWMAAAVWSDRSVKSPGLQHQLLYRAFVAIGAALLFGMYRHRVGSELRLWHSPGPVAWLMVALTLLGLLFTWWARITLGRLWSSNVARKAHHHVVETGGQVVDVLAVERGHERGVDPADDRVCGLAAVVLGHQLRDILQIRVRRTTDDVVGHEFAHLHHSLQHVKGRLHLLGHEPARDAIHAVGRDREVSSHLEPPLDARFARRVSAARFAC